MPITNDDGGSGGGTTTIVCTPSPSDQLAITNNLISRISDIERFLSMLVGADVYASNLSELATDMGNLLNGTIIMPGTNWAGEGGSIPVPDGFTGTVISGNVTTIWTDGVVSFQVDSTGIVTGVASFSWAQVSILATASAITSISELEDTNGIVSVSSPTITITNSGLYLFAMQDDLSISHTAAAYGLLQLADASFTLPGQATVCEAGQVISGSTSGFKFARLGTSTVTTIPSAGFNLTASASSSGGTWNHAATVSILKLS